MISVLTCLFALVRVVSAEVCSPTQCIPGTFNTTLGASFSSVILLPGTYSSDSAASQLVSLSNPPSTPPGVIASDSSSFPYTVSLSSGALAFGTTQYNSNSTLVGLSSNLSSPRLPASLAVPPNTAVTFRSASSQSSLVIFASVPDTAQLPLAAPDLAFSVVQSTSCSPACASGGACTASGTCACAEGFSGSQCEQCAPGFFGPACQKCQDACCDDGMTGSGKCLGSKNETSSDLCGCDKGICGSGGSCTCNQGWASPTSGQNSTAKCSVCAPGFFLDTSGECQVCSQGCTACASPSGVCTTCRANFSPDPNDRTKCAPSTGSNTTTCPDGQFLDPATSTCSSCSPLCKTCTGPLSIQCVACGAGQFMGPGNRCVAVSSQGVCQGTKLVANNAKGICDACPSTCTSCSFPSFSVVSTPAQITCSACLPGFVLTPSKRCERTCPAGSFVSPQDGFTCTPCDGSCAECAGEATFCTACSGGRGALDGKCVGSCPSGTILSQSVSTNSTGTTCLSCHADCATCSGPGSTQCSTCPPSRPLKSSDGRCLPASSCGAQSFFDSASGSCRACDAGCANCAGAGVQMCTACPVGKVLQSGQCVDSGCGETYLGLCLSALVTSTKTTTTVGLSPLHGALVGTSSIGFFALGLLVWRRRARKQRAARTAAFADTLPDNDTNRGRWEWGRVWRMRREEGWFSGLRLLISGLGLRRKRRTQFHREMSLRKLGGQGRQPNRDSEEDPRWRNLRPRREAPDSFVFDRPVIPAAPGTGQSWWRERDSMDSGRGKAAEGAYGNINPESHFARTLSSVSGGSIRRPVIQHSETPEAERLEPDVTGASAHTFGVAPTIGRKASLGSHNNGLVDLKSNPTGSSTSQGMNRLASNQTGSDIQAGNWMLPNYTGMESVSTHFTGSVATQNTGLGIYPSQANSTLPLVGQQTGVSSVLSHRTGNSSVVFHHTGSSNSLSPHPTGASILVAQAGTRAAPGVPVSYAPFLDSSTNPQPRQPIRDGSNINPFSRTLAVTPRPSNESLMMSPPPQGIPSSPVWPGAVGGSYWYGSEPQGLQSQLKLGDKNPFRRI
ncbi:Proprotein convertase subtilisin/kexin type 5 OS=Rattus norvegicus GN=Pcsk5 PE=2 SV=3 [Rhizoctonia solani AG-1 IB]|uniref:Proprotein convertase subtilisin/kexin type 5 n=1 Tax=Thanatephorus cucumeris (strain AG1-IB / isolate 7/3/14) TaxID=1108050 RepID=A0A0B7FA86_THACB|nr:Proprotein convertase subtilisin/kexin type 5 OS=Rattus norvegicus GN=Pcsk5 PE=2 SV=3 [Rhizoctonia solani AG-1 IB]